MTPLTWVIIGLVVTSGIVWGWKCFCDQKEPPDFHEHWSKHELAKRDAANLWNKNEH